MSYVQYIDQTKIPGITSSVQPLYAPLTSVEQGLAVTSTDSSSISSTSAWYTAALDDPGYIRNLKAYDLQEIAVNNTDSYYITAYDNEGAFIDAAYGYSDLTQGFNAVENYINPFDPAVQQFVQSLYDEGIVAYDIAPDKQIVQLYNYIIKNFSYVAEAKDDWNFASETLYSKGGDCEDLSILLASAGLAVLLNAGLTYAEAEQKFTVVAGTHQQYGDHVFVQYLAGDNETYVLDPALAREGSVSRIDDFQKLSELKDFTVYFRFNDQQIIGDRSAIEQPGAQYIDPSLPLISRYADMVAEAIGLSGQETLDQLFIQTANYLRTHVMCPAGLPGCDLQNVVELGVGSSESLSVLMTDVFLALAQKQGYALTDIQSRIGVLQIKKDGRTETAVAYRDELGIERLVDFTDSIIDVHQQLQNISSVEDFYAMTSFVAANELEDVVCGRLITAAGQPTRREITRFNAQAGLVSEVFKTDLHKLTQAEMTTVQNALAAEGEFLSYSAVDEAAQAALSVLRNKQEVSALNESIIVDTTADFSVQSAQYTQKLINEMGNLSQYIKGDEFWTFNTNAFDLKKAQLLSYRNVLAVMAMIQEANMQGYNLVTEALEVAGSSENYRSIRASSIIQAETEYLMKDLTELRSEVSGTVTTHNQLVDQVKTKLLEEKQRVNEEAAILGGIATTVLGLALTLAASIASEAVVAALSAAVITAGAAAILNYIIGVVEKSSTLPAATVALNQSEQQKDLAVKKTEEVKKPQLEALKSALFGVYAGIAASSKEGEYSQASEAYADSNSTALVLVDNLGGQYQLLDAATDIAEKHSGRAGLLMYQDDNQFLFVEKELSRMQTINRVAMHLHSQKSRSRSIIHQEMSGLSSYTTAAAAQQMVEQEQAEILAKFQRIKETQSQYIQTNNDYARAKNEADKLTEKFTWEAAGFATGLVALFIPFIPLDPGSAMGLASFMFSTLREPSYDLDDNRPELLLPMLGADGTFGTMMGGFEDSATGTFSEGNAFNFICDEIEKGIVYRTTHNKGLVTNLLGLTNNSVSSSSSSSVPDYSSLPNPAKDSAQDTLNEQTSLYNTMQAYNTTLEQLQTKANGLTSANNQLKSQFTGLGWSSMQALDSTQRASAFSNASGQATTVEDKANELYTQCTATLSELYELRNSLSDIPEALTTEQRANMDADSIAKADKDRADAISQRNSVNTSITKMEDLQSQCATAITDAQAAQALITTLSTSLYSNEIYTSNYSALQTKLNHITTIADAVNSSVTTNLLPVNAELLKTQETKVSEAETALANMSASVSLDMPDNSTSDSDDLSTELPIDYYALYRDRISYMRDQIVKMANMQRIAYLLQRYTLESRNIIHQEMTSTSTYEVSDLASQALSSESQYLLSALGAYASRQEQRIQASNTRLDALHARLKKAIMSATGPVSSVAAVAYETGGAEGLVALTALSGLMIAANPLVGSIMAAMAIGVLATQWTILVEAARKGDIDTSELETGTISGRVTEDDPNTVGRYDLDITDCIDSYSETFGITGATSAYYALNTSKLQAKIKNIYSEGYQANVLSVLQGARAASRSMIHQVMTNVSSLTQSSLVQENISAETQQFGSRVQDLTSKISDVIALKQKKADSDFEKQVSVFKIATLAAAAIVCGIAALFPPYVDFGTFWAMTTSVSRILDAITDLTKSYFMVSVLENAKNEFQKQAYETDMAILDKNKDATPDNSEDNTGVLSTAMPSTSDTADVAKVKLMIMKAEMKKLERINTIRQKIARMKAQARGQITSKISGTSGAQLGSAAQAMAGMEFGAAQAMLDTLIQQTDLVGQIEQKMKQAKTGVIAAWSAMVSTAIATYDSAKKIVETYKAAAAVYNKVGGDNADATVAAAEVENPDLKTRRENLEKAEAAAKAEGADEETIGKIVQEKSGLRAGIIRAEVLKQLKPQMSKSGMESLGSLATIGSAWGAFAGAVKDKDFLKSVGEFLKAVIITAVDLAKKVQSAATGSLFDLSTSANVPDAKAKLRTLIAEKKSVETKPGEPPKPAIEPAPPKPAPVPEPEPVQEAIKETRDVFATQTTTSAWSGTAAKAETRMISAGWDAGKATLTNAASISAQLGADVVGITGITVTTNAVSTAGQGKGAADMYGTNSNALLGNDPTQLGLSRPQAIKELLGEQADAATTAGFIVVQTAAQKLDAEAKGAKNVITVDELATKALGRSPDQDVTPEQKAERAAFIKEAMNNPAMRRMVMLEVATLDIQVGQTITMTRKDSALLEGETTDATVTEAWTVAAVPTLGDDTIRLKGPDGREVAFSYDPTTGVIGQPVGAGNDDLLSKSEQVKVGEIEEIVPGKPAPALAPVATPAKSPDAAPEVVEGAAEKAQDTGAEAAASPTGKPDLEAAEKTQSPEFGNFIQQKIEDGGALVETPVAAGSMKIIQTPDGTVTAVEIDGNKYDVVTGPDGKQQQLQDAQGNVVGSIAIAKTTDTPVLNADGSTTTTTTTKATITLTEVGKSNEFPTETLLKLAEYLNNMITEELKEHMDSQGKLNDAKAAAGKSLEALALALAFLDPRDVTEILSVAIRGVGEASSEKNQQSVAAMNAIYKLIGGENTDVSGKAHEGSLAGIGRYFGMEAIQTSKQLEAGQQSEALAALIGTGDTKAVARFMADQQYRHAVTEAFQKAKTAVSATTAEDGIKVMRLIMETTATEKAPSRETIEAADSKETSKVTTPNSIAQVTKVIQDFHARMQQTPTTSASDFTEHQQVQAFVQQYLDNTPNVTPQSVVAMMNAIKNGTMKIIDVAGQKVPIFMNNATKPPTVLCDLSKVDLAGLSETDKQKLMTDLAAFGKNAKTEAQYALQTNAGNILLKLEEKKVSVEGGKEEMTIVATLLSGEVTLLSGGDTLLSGEVVAAKLLNVTVIASEERVSVVPGPTGDSRGTITVNTADPGFDQTVKDAAQAVGQGQLVLTIKDPQGEPRTITCDVADGKITQLHDAPLTTKLTLPALVDGKSVDKTSELPIPKTILESDAWSAIRGLQAGRTEILKPRNMTDLLRGMETYRLWTGAQAQVSAFTARVDSFTSGDIKPLEAYGVSAITPQTILVDGKETLVYSVTISEKQADGTMKDLTFTVSDPKKFLTNIKEDIAFAKKCAAGGFDISGLDVTDGLQTLKDPKDPKGAAFTVVNSRYLSAADTAALAKMTYYTTDGQEANKYRTDFHLIADGVIHDVKYTPGFTAEVANTIVLLLVAKGVNNVVATSADAAAVAADKAATDQIVMDMAKEMVGELDSVAKYSAEDGSTDMLLGINDSLQRLGLQRSTVLSTIKAYASSFGAGAEIKQEGPLYDDLRRAEKLQGQLADFDLALTAAIEKGDVSQNASLLRQKNDLECAINGPDYARAVAELRETLTKQTDPKLSEAEIEARIANDPGLAGARKITLALSAAQDSPEAHAFLENKLSSAQTAVKLHEATLSRDAMQREVGAWASMPGSLSGAQRQFYENHQDLVTKHRDAAQAELTSLNEQITKLEGQQADLQRQNLGLLGLPTINSTLPLHTDEAVTAYNAELDKVLGDYQDALSKTTDPAQKAFIEKEIKRIGDLKAAANASLIPVTAAATRSGEPGMDAVASGSAAVYAKAYMDLLVNEFSTQALDGPGGSAATQMLARTQNPQYMKQAVIRAVNKYKYGGFDDKDANSELRAMRTAYSFQAKPIEEKIKALSNELMMAKLNGNEAEVKRISAEIEELSINLEQIKAQIAALDSLIAGVTSTLVSRAAAAAGTPMALMDWFPESILDKAARIGENGEALQLLAKRRQEDELLDKKILAVQSKYTAALAKAGSLEEKAAAAQEFAQEMVKLFVDSYDMPGPAEKFLDMVLDSVETGKKLVLSDSELSAQLAILEKAGMPAEKLTELRTLIAYINKPVAEREPVVIALGIDGKPGLTPVGQETNPPEQQMLMCADLIRLLSFKTILKVHFCNESSAAYTASSAGIGSAKEQANMALFMAIRSSMAGEKPNVDAQGRSLALPALEAFSGLETSAKALFDAAPKGKYSAVLLASAFQQLSMTKPEQEAYIQVLASFAEKLAADPALSLNERFEALKDALSKDPLLKKFVADGSLSDSVIKYLAMTDSEKTRVAFMGADGQLMTGYTGAVTQDFEKTRQTVSGLVQLGAALRRDTDPKGYTDFASDTYSAGLAKLLAASGAERKDWEDYADYKTAYYDFRAAAGFTFSSGEAVERTIGGFLETHTDGLIDSLSQQAAIGTMNGFSAGQTRNPGRPVELLKIAALQIANNATGRTTRDPLGQVVKTGVADCGTVYTDIKAMYADIVGGANIQLACTGLDLQGLQQMSYDLYFMRAYIELAMPESDTTTKITINGQEMDRKTALAQLDKDLRFVYEKMMYENFCKEMKIDPPYTTTGGTITGISATADQFKTFQISFMRSIATDMANLRADGSGNERSTLATEQFNNEIDFNEDMFKAAGKPTLDNWQYLQDNWGAAAKDGPRFSADLLELLRITAGTEVALPVKEIPGAVQKDASIEVLTKDVPPPTQPIPPVGETIIIPPPQETAAGIGLEPSVSLLSVPRNIDTAAMRQQNVTAGAEAAMTVEDKKALVSGVTLSGSVGTLDTSGDPVVTLQSTCLKLLALERMWIETMVSVPGFTGTSHSATDYKVSFVAGHYVIQDNSGNEYARVDLGKDQKIHLNCNGVDLILDFQIRLGEYYKPDGSLAGEMLDPVKYFATGALAPSDTLRSTYAAAKYDYAAFKKVVFDEGNKLLIDIQNAQDLLHGFTRDNVKGTIKKGKPVIPPKAVLGTAAQCMEYKMRIIANDQDVRAEQDLLSKGFGKYQIGEQTYYVNASTGQMRIGLSGPDLPLVAPFFIQNTDTGKKVGLLTTMKIPGDPLPYSIEAPSAATVGTLRLLNAAGQVAYIIQDGKVYVGDQLLKPETGFKYDASDPAKPTIVQVPPPRPAGYEDWQYEVKLEGDRYSVVPRPVITIDGKKWYVSLDETGRVVSLSAGKAEHCSPLNDQGQFNVNGTLVTVNKDTFAIGKAQPVPTGERKVTIPAGALPPFIQTGALDVVVGQDNKLVIGDYTIDLASGAVKKGEQLVCTLTVNSGVAGKISFSYNTEEINGVVYFDLGAGQLLNMQTLKIEEKAVLTKPATKTVAKQYGVLPGLPKALAVPGQEVVQG